MKYAIVESGGKQYKAVEGETLEVDRLPVEAGAELKLEQVLLLADGETFTVGKPVVKDTPVWTRVIEHFKGEKVIIFNYSPKKRIRVKAGHRQNYTRLLVEQIGGSELIAKQPVEKVAKVRKSSKTVSEAKPVVVAKKKPAVKKAAAKPAASKAAKPAAAKAAKPAATKATKTAATKAAKPVEKPAKKATPKPAAAKKTPAEKK